MPDYPGYKLIEVLCRNCRKVAGYGMFSDPEREGMIVVCEECFLKLNSPPTNPPRLIINMNKQRPSHNNPNCKCLKPSDVCVKDALAELRKDPMFKWYSFLAWWKIRISVRVYNFGRWLLKLSRKIGNN